MLDQADKVTPKDGLIVGPAGDQVLLKGAKIPTSTGDEPGSVGGVISSQTKGECEIIIGSSSVVYGPDALGLVRFMDATTQNGKNATGFVISAFPTVLVGD